MLTHLAWLTARYPSLLVQEKLSYLQKREAQMQYPAYQAAGWPIGSGSVESANKVVVEARVLATWVIRSEKGIKYWEKTSIVSRKVNKQLSISSCLNLFAKQMERGDKISFSRDYFLNG